MLGRSLLVKLLGAAQETWIFNHNCLKPHNVFASMRGAAVGMVWVMWLNNTTHAYCFLFFFVGTVFLNVGKEQNTESRHHFRLLC